ncbi:MAG: SusD/RagB family nutrient-binding outer membrane lipoprotein [Gemmatimonadetes bacterium]|nr:SusD/RagB family nutrient-binding outer membrane lipoprotein [Gemmatimonadota bacterium]
MALGAGLVGCVDFTGPALDQSPNQSSAASAQLLFPAVQAFQQAVITGDAARFAGIWNQHVMGVNRQFSSLARYQLVDENLQFWDNNYTGGGLVDLRTIQSQMTAANNKVFLGIAQAYEAMVMDFVADNWGNIPYREAVNPAIATPKLDPQAQVYGDLQALLTTAIANINSGVGGGPGTKDLVYGGSVTKWTQFAHTLKARIALHQRDYTTAAAEAALGISTKANDYNTYQSGSIGEENQWFQFRRNRGTDISASDTLVTLMQSRNDPRLLTYFAVNGAGVVKGAKAGDEDDGTFSWLSATRGGASFKQPIVTYDETQLILAEASFRNGNTAAALAALTAYKTANAIPAPSPAAGQALAQEIMNEKYIAMFQNIESWNDYKRTCTPNLRPNPTAVAPQTKIPMRFYYPSSERQTNPNVPAPGAQSLRNPIDGTTAPTPYNAGAPGNPATCLGQ